MGNEVVTISASEVSKRLGIDGHITDVWTADYATDIKFVVSPERAE